MIVDCMRATLQSEVSRIHSDSWPGDAELEDLVSKFSRAALPKADWTHRAHLAVGSWHVVHSGAARALEELRSGIIRLNSSHGTANTPDAGYHETITRAYVELLALWLAQMPQGTEAGALARSVLQSELGEREILLRYWSREVLMSREARAEWVAPDRRALGGLQDKALYEPGRSGC